LSVGHGEDRRWVGDHVLVDIVVVLGGFLSRPAGQQARGGAHRTSCVGLLFLLQRISAFCTVLILLVAVSNGARSWVLERYCHMELEDVLLEIVILLGWAKWYNPYAWPAQIVLAGLQNRLVVFCFSLQENKGFMLKATRLAHSSTP
jgi:hypothetical protein